jgi:hypothetical protein
MSVKDWKSKVKCPKCGRMANQNLLVQHSSGGIDSQMREYTMEGACGTRLYGASYLPQQLEDAKKKHPNRRFRLVNGCYLPVIRHRRDKLQYLKEYGNYVEYD